MAFKRTDKNNYYLDIAQTVLERGTCLRRNYGAIIVKNDEIISTGYTGAPRGRANCLDLGYCYRQKQNIPRGERYETCRSVHAEANCIISALRGESNRLFCLLGNGYRRTCQKCRQLLNVQAYDHKCGHCSGYHPRYRNRV